ncbi:MAG TPA: NADH-quinone oxidoreductase subunit N [Opitutaceae bacterium]|nr:NADH-quinone oxidoreductase subunit N [Opitutaceae bacterium]
MTPDYTGLVRALLPEAALVAGALVVLGLDLAFFRRRAAAFRLRAAIAVAALATVAAIGLALGGGARGEVFGGVLIFDSLAVAARLGVLVLVLLVLGISTGAPTPRHPAEYAAIILFAAVGFTLMAAAQQLLLAFLALELASLSLYVLAGFDKSRPESVEAALKYFLFGGMSAAFLLFGFSLIYGLAGSIELPRIAESLAQQGLSPLLAVALVMVLVAFGFKAAAAPFHLWAPDAYEGAPTPSAALIASASKLAGFVLFARLLWPGLHAVAGNVAAAPVGGGWLPVVAVLSGASLLLGNLGALAQTNVRRLLAYSAIAHAGTLLLGVIAFGAAGPAPLFYYAATYGIATAGAFGVIAVLERAGGCEKITDLAGLHRRSPLLAGCLLVFILSLAGIPPLAGFFGKFAVFAAALQLGGAGGPAGWLTFAAIFLSAVALYYYLVVLKQALVAVPAEQAGPVAVPGAAALTLLAAAALIVFFGLCPSLLLDFF